MTGHHDLAPGAPLVPPGFAGSSAIMRGVHDRIRLAAGSRAPVFVTGQCGSGKELCARAIHKLSDRAGGAFVTLNCAGIAPELIMSELFGQMGGAITRADGGTLFLDEIGALSPRLQAMLLQVLQTAAIQPAGADRPQPVDVRIISAAKQDLLEAVQEGQFRDDLYYRLHVIPIHMPPLSDRGQDVVEIAEAALPRIAAEEGRRFRGLDATARALLPALPWPGNVRQLLNMLRHIVVMNDADLITATMFPAQPHGAEVEALPKTVDDSATLPTLLGRSLAQIERLVIEATIIHEKGSITRAARVLEVAPSTIYRKMESWGVESKRIR